MKKESLSKSIARIALGTFLAFAGTSHLTFARRDFKAQVPDLVPFDKDTTVVLSGEAEISLGLALILLAKEKKDMGWISALFFLMVFPGNISQYTHRRSAFGLNTDRRRFIRLFFQPLLIAWALWATSACDKQLKLDK